MTQVRGLATFEYGVVQAIYYVAGVAFEVPTGAFADRFGRRSALVVGGLANALGCAAMALAYGFWPFAAGVTLFALSTAMVSGADSALLYDSLATERRESEYARAEGAGTALWLFVTAAGFVLADALLVVDGDPVRAYWVGAVFALAAAGLAAAMREPPRVRPASTFAVTRGAFADVARAPGILRVIVYSVGVFLLLRAAIVAFYNPVLHRAGIARNDYGKVLAAVNVVGAGGALLAPRLAARFGERACLVAMAVSLLAMFALLAPLRTPLAASLFLVQGLVFGAYPAVVRAILNRRVPSPPRRATVLSIESLACRLAYAALSVYAGWALSALDLAAALATTAALASLPFLALPLLRRGP